VSRVPYTFTWSGVPVGTYRLTAKATDNSGAVTTSAAVNAIVSPAANVPPTVTITSPGNNVLFNAPADVVINAGAFDLDGTVGKVEFFSGTALLATVTSSPYTFTWDQVAIGAYDLTARATDNSGGVTVSSVVTISVSPPANVPPTVSITSPVNNGNLIQLGTGQLPKLEEDMYRLKDEDLFLNPTSRLADYVLPAAHWLEKRGRGAESYDVRIRTSVDEGATDRGQRVGRRPHRDRRHLQSRGPPLCPVLDRFDVTI
jgi:hypothetical protein